MTGNIMTMFVQNMAENLREYNKYTAQSGPAINNLASSSGIKNTSRVSEVKNEELGKDAFLQLLVTQLRYQDPLSPMDNGEFIAQMAQFSALEQMQNMNINMENFLRTETLSQGASLIGRTVELIDSHSGEIIAGKVERVSFLSGSVYVHLDSDYVTDINYITAVY
ncbi:MAG: flagellar hook capping protein [Halanaerobiaceae bacterium]|nr:flagellar hook capping protein [Halanaerobiaceae bacterium]